MPTTQEPSAIGVFTDIDKAERIIDELRRAGFQPDEIGVIGNVGQDEAVPTPPEANAPEDNAVNGFVRGALIGAIVGGFVILVIPGLGAVAGVGRWFEIVGGIALGALASGLLLAFSSFVFMRPRTRLIASELRKGNIIVTVTNQARKEEAVSVLQRRGLRGDVRTERSSEP